MVVYLKNGLIGKKLPVFGILLSEKEIRLNSMNKMYCSLLVNSQLDGFVRYFVNNECQKLYKNKTQATFNYKTIISNYRKSYNKKEISNLTMKNINYIGESSKYIYYLNIPLKHLGENARYLCYVDSNFRNNKNNNTLHIRCKSGLFKMDISCKDISVFNKLNFLIEQEINKNFNNRNFIHIDIEAILIKLGKDNVKVNIYIDNLNNIKKVI